MIESWMQGVGVVGMRRRRILLAVTTGLALFGIFASLWKWSRRRKAVSEEGKKNGHVVAFTDCQTEGVHRGMSPFVGGGGRGGRYGYIGGSMDNFSSSVRSSLNSEALICLGLDNLVEAIKHWERAAQSTSDITVSHTKREEELMEKVREIVNRATEVQTALQKVVEKYGLELPSLPDNVSIASTLTGTQGLHGLALEGHPRFAGRRTMSILSDDSFVSALEDMIPTFEFDDVDILGREPLNLDPSDLRLYQMGIKAVREDSVLCRVNRIDFLHCASEEEFLAKLWCIRKAFKLILSEEPKRSLLIESGRNMIGDLLRQAHKEPGDFFEAFDRMMEFLHDETRWPDVEEELKTRRVPYLTFYDVVLDLILMDAFDDLASPPSAVIAVSQNRFLSASFKESTLNTVVWSVLRAKRARLTVADGFMAKFYDISEHVSPAMAWGFLGTDEQLREVCYYFKDQICSFLVDIFSFDRVRFTNLVELSEDLWMLLRTRTEMIKHRMSPELLVEE